MDEIKRKIPAYEIITLSEARKRVPQIASTAIDDDMHLYLNDKVLFLDGDVETDGYIPSEDFAQENFGIALSDYDKQGISAVIINGSLKLDWIHGPGSPSLFIVVGKTTANSLYSEGPIYVFCSDATFSHYTIADGNDGALCVNGRLTTNYLISERQTVLIKDITAVNRWIALVDEFSYEQFLDELKDDDGYVDLGDVANLLADRQEILKV